jgi:lysophospholipase L1-like esterase
VPPAVFKRQHAARQSQLSAWAARNGATILNIFAAFLDDPRFDGTAASPLYNADGTGLHPSPAGWDLWASIVERALRTGA